MENYKTPEKLNQRISIHEKYSVNRQGYGNWIFSHYELRENLRILECGCGTGDIWKNHIDDIPKGCSLTLTDASEGMVADVRERFSGCHFIDCALADIQELPYEDNSYDIVIANAMLYHVPDITRGLREARRVLREGGVFYASTYGEHGMLDVLIQWLPEIPLQEKRNLRFTLQNGERQIKEVFSDVVRHDYEDALAVTSVHDIVDYIYSLPSASDLSESYYDQIARALSDRMENGVLMIPKEYGLFVAS